MPIMDNMSDIHKAEEHAKRERDARLKSFPHCHHFQLQFKDPEHAHILDKHIVLSFDRSVARQVLHKHIINNFSAYSYKSPQALLKNLMIPEESTSCQVTLYDDQVLRQCVLKYMDIATVDELNALRLLIESKVTSGSDQRKSKIKGVRI